MTRDELIELARKSGAFLMRTGGKVRQLSLSPDTLEAFAAALAAAKAEPAEDAAPGYEKMRGGKPAVFWRDDALEAAAGIVEAYRADHWIARDIRAMKSKAEAERKSASQEGMS